MKTTECPPEYIPLEQGDIGATKGRGIAGWASRTLLSPTTDRFHFFILWRRLGDDDFLILESISKGVAVGRLSWYQGQDVEFYRVNCDEDLRVAAPDGLINWGRAGYDRWLIIKLLFSGIVALTRIVWRECRIRRLRAEDFPYAKNDALICTEAVDIAYDSAGVNIIPQGVIPLPSAFKEAELEGRLIRLPLQHEPI